MKKLIILFFTLMCIARCFAQETEYTLKGYLNGYEDKNGWTVYLQTTDYDNITQLKMIDSTYVTNGTFTLKEKIGAQPQVRLVSIQSPQSTDVIGGIFVTEPTEIIMNIDSSGVRVKGLAENEKLEAYQAKQEKLYKQAKTLQDSIQQLYFSGNLSPQVSNEAQEQFRLWQGELSSLVYDFTLENIKNNIGEFYFIAYVQSFTPEQLKNLYAASTPEYKEKKAVKNLMQRIVWSKESSLIGQQFPDLTLLTPEGKKEKLSDYIGKGKVVLLDFWASWCRPCRIAMPELKSTYDEFKDKGFEIVAISLDERESAWKNAIESIGMTWINFSDLGGWNSEATSAYGVDRVPLSFLIDKDGKIVAFNLKGNELKNHIQSLLEE